MAVLYYNYDKKKMLHKMFRRSNSERLVNFMEIYCALMKVLVNSDFNHTILISTDEE